MTESMQLGETGQARAQAEAEVALVGFGTAAVNAAIALRNAGYEGRIRVFSDTAIPPYSPILTSYYAGGRKTFEQCFPWGADDIADLNLTVMQECPVERLDPAAHTLHTPKGDFAYVKCLIATGATPQAFGFPGVEGEPDFRPFMLRTMDDAARLRAALEDPACKRMLVSGASMVALKILEAFLDQGKQAALVGMNPHVLDMNALPEPAMRFERGLEAAGVQLYLGQTIKSVRRIGADGGEDAGRLEVTFSTGARDVFDGIAVAHGMASNLGFLEKDALETDRALVVDEFMRTSNADVYAAGDVVQGLELVSGQKRIVGIWKNAAVQGACAGRAIALEMAGGSPGPEDAFKGAIATNSIDVCGMLFISAGSVELAEGRHMELREGDGMIVAYVFQDDPDGSKRLVGFNLVSDTDEEGGVAYDTGAMLTLRIEAACRR